MKYFYTSILIFLSLIKPSFGVVECKKEKEAKDRVISALKETSSPKDLIVGSSTIINQQEPFCRYNIYATWKGLDQEGKEKYFMQHFELDNNFVILNAPWLIYGEKVPN